MKFETVSDFLTGPSRRPQGEAQRAAGWAWIVLPRQPLYRVPSRKRKLKYGKRHTTPKISINHQ